MLRKPYTLIKGHFISVRRLSRAYLYSWVRGVNNVLLDGVENRSWRIVLNKAFFDKEVYSDEDDVWDDEGRSYHKNIMANEDDAFYWLW